MNASSPYIWRQLMVPLVQLTAWWPSCAPRKASLSMRLAGAGRRSNATPTCDWRPALTAQPGTHARPPPSTFPPADSSNKQRQQASFCNGVRHSPYTPLCSIQESEHSERGCAHSTSVPLQRAWQPLPNATQELCVQPAAKSAQQKHRQRCPRLAADVAAAGVPVGIAAQLVVELHGGLSLAVAQVCRAA